MRKELLVAICAGTLLGVLAAFGIWKANKNLQAEGISGTPFVPSTTQELSPTPSPTSFKPRPIEAISPMDTDVVMQGTTSFSGKTTPNTWVSLSSESEDILVKSTDDGIFQHPLPLLAGVNQIVMNSFDTKTTPHNIVTTVIYSSTFPVQGSDKPKAYVGIVTDKTENSLQIKDIKGSLLLLSLDPKTLTVVKIAGTTQKDASYADLAIGDSIAALGYVGGSSVLDTKRILLTTVMPITRRAFIGIITDVTRNKITFKVSDGTVYTVDSNKSLVTTTGLAQDKILFSDLEADQTIIATGILEGTNITGRRIHVVE